MTFFLLFCNDSDMFFYRKLPTIILCEHYTSFLQPLCIYSHHVHLTVIVKRFSSSHWFSTFRILKCHVCSEDGDGDSRLTRDQSQSRLFQLNPPKKINTAGSASAACNNTIRGKGREFGQLQIHTYTHKDDIYGMDGLLWSKLYALPVVLSKNGMKNKKRKVLLGSHREDCQRRSTTLQITKSPLKTQSRPFICACLLSARNSLW